MFVNVSKEMNEKPFIFFISDFDKLDLAHYLGIP